MPIRNLKENFAISLRNKMMAAVTKPASSQGSRTVEIKPGGKPK